MIKKILAIMGFGVAMKMMIDCVISLDETRSAEKYYREKL